MTRDEVLEGLKAKRFWGTLDRLETGAITLEQAEHELLGGAPDTEIHDEPLPDGVFNRSWDEIKRMQGGGLKR